MGSGRTFTRRFSLAVAIVAALVLAIGMPGRASAAACVVPGPNPGNCEINTAITTCPFNLTVTGNLVITSTGSISCSDPATPVTINVGGDMEMQAGSAIRAEDTNDGGNGGNITLTVGGNFTMRGGAVISSSKTAGAGDTGAAGDIRITVGNVKVNPDDLTITCATTPLGDILVENGAQILANGTGDAGAIKMFAGKNATIKGLVSSQGLDTFKGRGGPITIDACCDLVIGDTGQVISQGRDPGADLVHLQGCIVQIFGLVASTGPGHEGFAGNLCNSPNRPGKPANSSACVEIWAGTTLLIDSTGTHKGEVNADTATGGDIQGSSWIDVLANGAITIRGNATAPAAGNNDTSPAYAVHANQFSQNGHGGDITVISKDSTVTMFGRALQANASTGSNGGKGGHIVILAHDAVPFGTGVVPAFVQAAGDTTGGANPPPGGGTILAQSYNGNVTGPPGSQLNVEGGIVPNGTATLDGCADPAVTYEGAVIPAGAESDLQTCPGGSPPLPIPAATLIPSATCANSCGLLPAGNKSGVKFHDLNGNGVQDPGDPGLPGWTIHLFNTATKALLQSTVTAAANVGPPPTPDGFYSFFALDPGSYTVCEAQLPGWQQTAPNGAVPIPAGETQADCAPFAAANALTLGPRGYNFTITANEVFSNNDFGNFVPGACLKFPNLLPTKTFLLNADPTQIQKIIDAASTGDVILLLPQNGVKTESITINKKIQLIGCSITLNSATGGPVVTITSGANGGLTKDIHATGSTVAGYKIEGSNHTIVNARAFKNAIGFWITGNSNVVTGALGTLGNGTGVRIDGSSNVLDTNNGVDKSTGDGVVIGAGATGNTVKKYTVRGSGGNGFKVEAGASLTVLSENKAYSNGLNGYLILGSDTTMSKNIAGDTGTGNAGDGIRVVGNNGPMSENVSKANTLVGFRVTGIGHKLTKNKSGGTSNQNNASCQYVVGGSNVNGGSNTSSNGATFTFTTAANSPAGCLPVPPTP